MNLWVYFMFIVQWDLLSKKVGFSQDKLRWDQICTYSGLWHGRWHKWRRRRCWHRASNAGSPRIVQKTINALWLIHVYEHPYDTDQTKNCCNSMFSIQESLFMTSITLHRWYLLQLWACQHLQWNWKWFWVLFWEIGVMGYTCRLRATVRITQAPQQIPNPIRSSSFLPEASTINTCAMPKHTREWLVMWNILVRVWIKHLLQQRSWGHSQPPFQLSRTECGSLSLRLKKRCCPHSNKSADRLGIQSQESHILNQLLQNHTGVHWKHMERCNRKEWCSERFAVSVAWLTAFTPDNCWPMFMRIMDNSCQRRERKEKSLSTESWPSAFSDCASSRISVISSSTSFHPLRRCSAATHHSTLYSL